MLHSRNSQKNNNFLLFHIFFITLSILSTYSGAEPAPVPGDIQKMLVKYQTVLRSFRKFIPKSEYSYFDSIIQAGKPREVKIEKNTIALEIPLISSDYSARFAYMSPDMEKVLQFPLPGETIGRYLLTAREWNDIASAPAAVPGSYFSAAPEDKGEEDFFYLLRERYGNLYEKLGIAVKEEDLKSFEMIKFFEAVPARSIMKKKIRLKENEFSDEEFTALKSFSYAAAYCSDWWHIASSNSSEIIFERYRDAISNKSCFGMNPRLIDALYQVRSKDDPEVFSFSNYLKDPLFPNEMVHSSLEGYASLLVLPEEYEFLDPNDRSRTYRIQRGSGFYMGEEYISLFENFDGTDETLVTALNTHGIVLAGIPFYMNGAVLKNSARAVAVIGHKKEGGATLFVYRDFEDPPQTYRIARTGLFREAYCFPHEFSAKAKYIVKKRKLVIETFDKKGEGMDVDEISATFPEDDKKVKFLKEGRGSYFHQVKKEDFAGVERATLIAGIKKRYFVKGDKDMVELKYAIY